MFRKLLLGVVFVLSAAFLISNYQTMRAQLLVLENGNLAFILLALLVALGFFFSSAALYRMLYRILQIDVSLIELVPISAAAFFMNVIAPSAGLSSIAVFVSEARRREEPVGRVTVASTLFVFFDLAGFMAVLLIGIFILWQQHNLTLTEIAATGYLTGLAGALGFVFYVGARSALRLENLLAKLVRWLNTAARWFGRKAPVFTEERAREFAQDTAEGIAMMRAQKRNFFYPLVLGIANRASFITVLWLVFLAFGIRHTSGTIIGGYSIAYLFTIASPTPAGVGVVEGLMTLGLASLKVPLSQATVVTLAYRGVTFWFLLLFGMFAFQYIKRRPVSNGMGEGEAPAVGSGSRVR
jgi:hypothetical protein